MKNWIKSLVLLAVGAWFLTGCAVYETNKKNSCGSTKALGVTFSGSIDPNVKCEKPLRETTTTTTTTSKPQSKLETVDEPAEERREDRGETMVEVDNGPDNRSNQVAEAESSEQPVITEDKEVVQSDDGTTTTTTVVTKEFAQAAPPAQREVVNSGYSYSGYNSYVAPVYYTEYSNGYYCQPGTVFWFHWEWDSSAHRYHVMRSCGRPSFYVYETGRCVERGEGNQWLHHNSPQPPDRHVADRVVEHDTRATARGGNRTEIVTRGSTAAPTEHRRGVDGMRSSSSTSFDGRDRPVASQRGRDEDRGDRNGRTTHTTTRTEYRTNTGCADCDQQDRVNNQHDQRDEHDSNRRDNRVFHHTNQPTGQTPIYDYNNRGNNQGGDQRGGDNNRNQVGNQGGGFHWQTGGRGQVIGNGQGVHHG